MAKSTPYYLPSQQVDAEKLADRRRIAEAMIAQSMQPMGGTQFVGRTAVRRSPLEGIAKLAQAYFGNQQGKQIDTDQAALQERQRSDMASALDEYTKATNARPGSSEQIMDEQANGGEGAMATITAPPYAPSAGDKRSAAMNLMGRIGDPRDAAKMMVADALKPRELKTGKPGDVFYDPATGQQQGSIPAAQKYHTVGGNLVPEPAAPGAKVEPVFTTPEKVDYNKPFLPDGKPNTAYQGYALDKARAGKSSVSVALPGQEKAFEQELGKGQAKALIEGRKGADDAAEIINTVNLGRKILKDGMVTGFGANAIVSVGQALKQAGIDFGGDATANAQAYSANMAQNVGKLIKQFGSGTGLSDADREYAIRMAGGQITLDKSAIEKILNINEMAARNLIKIHNRRAEGVSSNIPLRVDEPPSVRSGIPSADAIDAELRRRAGGG